MPKSPFSTFYFQFPPIYVYYFSTLLKLMVFWLINRFLLPLFNCLQKLCGYTNEYMHYEYEEELVFLVFWISRDIVICKKWRIDFYSSWTTFMFGDDDDDNRAVKGVDVWWWHVNGRLNLYYSAAKLLLVR